MQVDLYNGLKTVVCIDTFGGRWLGHTDRQNLQYSVTGNMAPLQQGVRNGRASVCPIDQSQQWRVSC